MKGRNNFLPCPLKIPDFDLNCQISRVNRKLRTHDIYKWNDYPKGYFLGIRVCNFLGKTS